MNRTGRYFYAIDGLRLLASINIVLFHYYRMGGLYDLGGKPGWIFTIIKGPMFHASMFFMLGGFIFTVKFSHRAEEFRSRPFWKKRFYDLYPLHAGTTLAMVPFAFMKTSMGTALWPAIVYSLGVHLSLLYSLIPMGVDPLNRPSWALSGFFFCYLLFKPMLRAVCRISQQRTLILLMVLCMVPSMGWALLYSYVSGKEGGGYFFFHVFAFFRLIEFFIGMALARVFLLNDAQALADKRKMLSFLEDAVVLVCAVLLFCMLYLKEGMTPFMRFLSYHTAVLPLYATMIYALCRARGWISHLFTIPAVRWLGQSSFYPYLLHIPLISWICWFSEHQLGYKTFLHNPWTLLGFIAALYAGCAWAWHNLKKHNMKN